MSEWALVTMDSPGMRLRCLGMRYGCLGMRLGCLRNSADLGFKLGSRDLLCGLKNSNSIVLGMVTGSEAKGNGSLMPSCPLHVDVWTRDNSD